MPGGVAIALTHEPSFRDSIEVEGNHPKLIVAEHQDRIAGVALMARKPVFIDGEPREVGYLSSLRLAQEVRSSSALARGYQIVRKVHEADPTVPFYLSTIMADNQGAREILTSGRAGLPFYHPIGSFSTVLIPIIRHRLTLPKGLRILRGDEVGAERILECLHRLGKTRQFFPVYQEEDLVAPHGLLRGLSLHDFYVAVMGERLVGTFACWDQTAFRQTVVTEYSSQMKWVKRGFDFLAGFTRMKPLPREGDYFHSLSAACITAEHPEIFESLLRYALNDRRGTGKTFLYVGLASNDPLLPVAEACLHTTLRSLIYAVEWEGDKVCIEQLGQRVPYLELGSL